MKRLLLATLILLAAGLLQAQSKATFDKLDKLADQMGIHATDIYHTQWPGDTIRPYVVKGFDKLDVYVDDFEKALLALEQELAATDILAKQKANCPDSLDWDEVETQMQEWIVEGKELVEAMRTNLAKYQKDKGTIFAVKSAAVLQAKIGQIYLIYGEDKTFVMLVRSLRYVCE